MNVDKVGLPGSRLGLAEAQIVPLAFIFSNSPDPVR